MSGKLSMLFGFLLSTGGCSHAALAPARAPAVAERPRAAAPAPSPAPPSPAETLAEADALHRSQLGASRAGQFEVDRQVAELRRAILLYQQFLDLAHGRPELEPAVRKSHEAIADLKATLTFLLGGHRAEGDPAAAAPR